MDSRGVTGGKKVKIYFGRIEKSYYLCRPEKGKTLRPGDLQMQGRPAEIRIKIECQHFGADFLWKFLEIMKHKKKARCTNFVNSWRKKPERKRLELFIYTTESLILAQDER